jgi:uncharacterized phage protein gp47/JayE
MPDLNSLYNEIKASFASTYNQNVSPLPKSFLNILSKVLAGLMNAVYKYGNFTSKQIFLKTASFEPITLADGTVIRPLVEDARKYGIGEPTPATQAELEAQAIVTAAGTIPSGTQLTNKATGVIYTTTQDYTVTSGTVNLSILASGDATNTGGFGVIGNMVIGDIVTFINPQITAAEASIVTILTTAADAETEDSYRNKAIIAARQPRLPNNYLWYREEAEEIGTVRVYPYTSSNAGFIDIYVKSTLSGSVIPTQTQLDEVLNAVVYDVAGIVQLPATLKPENINVLPVTTKTFSITISTINTNNEVASIQTAITAALQDLFANYEPYISAIDVTDSRKDLIDTQEINGVVYSTAKALGATVGSITLFEIISGNASTITKYLLDKDELATLTSVDYV